MSGDALQKAIDSLKIRDVYLRSSNASLEDEFEPKYDPDIDNLDTQLKHIVASSSVLELVEENDTRCIFRVFIELGVRWVAHNSEENEEPETRAFIESVMVAEYYMKSNPGAEALKLFAMQNASFHVWPYWREYVTSHCQRMNLPKMVMPAVQFSSNHDSD